MQRKRGCLGCFGGCFTNVVLILVACCAGAWVLLLVLNPWALHIGGRSTPLLYWHGVGNVISKDGKSYPLYVTFFPGRAQRHLIYQSEGKRWSADLYGSGWLCVSPGNKEQMQLSGTMYGSHTDSSANLFDFRMLEWRNSLFVNSSGRGFFDVAGQWQGQQLVMDRPNEQGAVFKSGLFIDHATVTLHWADKADFDAACGSGGH